MSLTHRVARLEGKTTPPPIDGPRVIFICDGETGEPMAAMIMGGGNLTRGPDETPEEFQARATEIYLNPERTSNETI